MKLYEVRITEYNGRQEYSSSHLVAAENITRAQELAKEYFEKWYCDGKDNHTAMCDSDKFEFMDGRIILRVNSISETNLEDWKQRQVESHCINKLPNVEPSCRKCQDLLESCGYVLDSFDTDGENSQQFFAAIAYLKDIVRQIHRTWPSNPSNEKNTIESQTENAQASVSQSLDIDYCTAAEYLANEGRKIFTGPMEGGLWNGRCMNACILSKREGDKAAYETLLKFGDEYVRFLPQSQKRLWQNIKKKANSLLKPVTNESETAK